MQREGGAPPAILLRPMSLPAQSGNSVQSDQVLPGLIEESESIFQVFAAGGAAWINKKPEHEDAEERRRPSKRRSEGEHGDRPASVTRTSSYGAHSVSRGMDLIRSSIGVD